MAHEPIGTKGTSGGLPATPERKRPITPVVITESPGSFQDRRNMFEGVKGGGAMAAPAPAGATTTTMSTKPPRSSLQQQQQHPNTPQTASPSFVQNRAAAATTTGYTGPSRRLDPPGSLQKQQQQQQQQQHYTLGNSNNTAMRMVMVTPEKNQQFRSSDHSYNSRNGQRRLAPPDLSQPRHLPQQQQQTQLQPFGSATSGFRQIRNTTSTSDNNSYNNTPPPATTTTMAQSPQYKMVPSPGPAAIQARLRVQRQQSPSNSLEETKTHRLVTPETKKDPRNSTGKSPTAASTGVSPFQPYNNHKNARQYSPSYSEERKSASPRIHNGSPVAPPHNNMARSKVFPNCPPPNHQPPASPTVSQSILPAKLGNTTPQQQQQQQQHNPSPATVRYPSPRPPPPPPAEIPTSPIPTAEETTEAFSTLRLQFSPRPNTTRAGGGQQPPKSKTVLRQPTVPPKQQQQQRQQQQQEPSFQNLHSAATIIKVLQSGETSPEQQQMAIENLPVSPIAVHNVEPTRIPNSHTDVILQIFGADCDLYRDVLLVDSKNASDRQIRVAYFRRGRELLMSSKDRAKKFSGLTVDAKAKFHAISLAYEIATRPDWRKSYNLYGWKQQQADLPLIPSDVFAPDIALANPTIPVVVKQESRSTNTSVTTSKTCESILRPAFRSKGLKTTKSPGRGIRWAEEVEELVYRRDPDEDREKNEAARASRQARKDFEQEALQRLQELEEIQGQQEKTGKKRKKKKVLIDVTQQMKDMEKRAFKNTFLDMVLNDIDTSLDGIEASIEGVMSAHSDRNVDGSEELSESSDQHASERDDSWKETGEVQQNQVPDAGIPTIPMSEEATEKSDDEVASDLLSTLTKAGPKLEHSQIDLQSRVRPRSIRSLSPRPAQQSSTTTTHTIQHPLSPPPLDQSSKRADKFQQIKSKRGNSLPPSIRPRKDTSSPPKVIDAFESFAEASSQRFSKHDDSDDNDDGKQTVRRSDRFQQIMSTKRGTSLPPSVQARIEANSPQRVKNLSSQPSSQREQGGNNESSDAIAPFSEFDENSIAKDAGSPTRSEGYSLSETIDESHAGTAEQSALTITSSKLGNQCNPCAPLALAHINGSGKEKERLFSDAITIDEDFHSLPSNEMMGKNGSNGLCNVADDDDADQNFFADLVVYLGRVSTDLTFGANRVVKDTQQILADTFLLPEDNVGQVLEVVGMGMKDDREEKLRPVSKSHTY